MESDGIPGDRAERKSRSLRCAHAPVMLFAYASIRRRKTEAKSIWSLRSPYWKAHLAHQAFKMRRLSKLSSALYVIDRYVWDDRIGRGE